MNDKVLLRFRADAQLGSEQDPRVFVHGVEITRDVVEATLLPLGRIRLRILEAPRRMVAGYGLADRTVVDLYGVEVVS